jgi:hypothetical protein
MSAVVYRIVRRKEPGCKGTPRYLANLMPTLA